MYSESETECLTNPAGHGYFGTTHVDALGRNCYIWLFVDITQTAGLVTDSTIMDASSYCRIVVDAKYDSVSCFVYKSGHSVLEKFVTFGECEFVKHLPRVG